MSVVYKSKASVPRGYNERTVWFYIFFHHFLCSVFCEGDKASIKTYENDVLLNGGQKVFNDAKQHARKHTHTTAAEL